MAASYPDYDRGPHLAAVYIAGCAVSFVFVAMRLMARFSIAGVGIDDWCMLITWIVFLPLTILLSILCFEGGTRHLSYLSQDPAHVVYVVKMNWVAQPLAIFCLGSGKIAVAFLIVRLLNRASVWKRWSLYVASAWTMINTILMIIFTFVQCEDPAALWDPSVKSRTKCWDTRVQSSFSIYGAAVHSLIDFYLALLPVTLVWGLQTSLRKRIALCALLGCGSITGICAAVKASKLISLNARSDFTWETFPLFLWTGIEIILLIVCGSIPALKPIYAICMGRRPSMRSSQNKGTGPSRKSTMRRSYARYKDTDTAIGLAGVSPSSAAVVSRVSEDEMELNKDYEKSLGGIHVTRTIAIE
ncbi:hypothetical protein BU26DRAFT_607965 [Trematosphaeria pertusa]|uniref:Rhodopsin domain-containing protein n=1 Tax=Trematosphaeria pertusa TaxID=390896 RepID=A0A6A6I6T9_9PLEO|nr:uncharacterized protein BU26DRAFT_607965 [Trematosphaeria pertusa]KAF2245788.1 hypothetical protein BU26DRAFT_607965 [Trematosphaeria pertusa]